MKSPAYDNTRKNDDLTDPPKDRKHLEPEVATLDLPEVKDIPGQEHIRPMPPGEMADVTISSADEEAEDLLAEVNEEDTAEDRNSNVTPDERELLRRSSESMSSKDDEELRKAAVDKTGEDGTPLNETTNLSGDELDVPGREDDDANEAIGEEDEENNSFSLPDQ